MGMPKDYLGTYLQEYPNDGNFVPDKEGPE